MGNIYLGVNMEFVRHDDKPFEWGVEKAAELGYEYVEPMVHWGRELLSEAGYFHSVSMLDDPYRVRRACEKAGIKLSGLSTHTPLTKPEIGTEYLTQMAASAAQHGISLPDRELACAPLDSALGTTAALQLAASLPDEGRAAGLATADRILQDPTPAPALRQGSLPVPAAPGLGTRPDPEALARVAGGPPRELRA